MRARRRCTHCTKQRSMRARRRYTHCTKQRSMRAQRLCGDPFGAIVIQTGSMSSTQMGPRYLYLYAAVTVSSLQACLSIPLLGSKQTIHVYFMFSTYLIFPIHFCHSVIICEIYTIIYSYLCIFHISLYA